ncbi:hypothetical protein SAMN04515671_1976 [Nakamurella panacisegetis]|uniref:Uncharacterized protein n=1 Tax=Nakamurella panacisegetis TaxID=1090615 RepID=A0A1H0MCC5_9ACTN|nr:hypothetical protein [Nakamurella panacisegetis]SDO78128.1 hypothetical protein SAMN04515671_1976 [Nakamurella panacisegetis]
MFTDADPADHFGSEPDVPPDHLEALSAAAFDDHDYPGVPGEHIGAAAAGDADGDGESAPAHGAEFVPTTEAEPSAPGPAPGADPPATHTAPDIVYTSLGGGTTDLGPPVEDLDGDGIAESVAVHTAAGDILVLSDTDGDGHPDQMIQIDPTTGTATWAVPDDHGGWDVVQTGHVDADGIVVVDHAQQTPAHVAARTDPDRGDVEVAVGGRSFDAGPATIDSDGDGVPDTVKVAGPGGSTLYYRDSDGDGVADRAWTTDPSGQVTANYTLEHDGTWAASGSAP